MTQTREFEHIRKLKEKLLDSNYEPNDYDFNIARKLAYGFGAPGRATELWAGAQSLQRKREVIIDLCNYIKDWPGIPEIRISFDPIPEGPAVTNFTMRASYQRLAPCDAVKTLTLKDKSAVTLRRLRPEDFGGLTAFLHKLSPASFAMRFPEAGAQDRSACIKLAQTMILSEFSGGGVLVAADESGDISGLADFNSYPSRSAKERFAGKTFEDPCEISVAVADAWHGKGMGAGLLREAMRLARDGAGYKEAIAIVKKENRAVIPVLGKLGMIMENASESSSTIAFSCDLSSLGEAPEQPRLHGAPLGRGDDAYSGRSDAIG